MKLTRLWLPLLVVGLMVAVPGIQAAEYPSKPVTLVVPYGPGGAADLCGRTLASVAKNYLGQPIVVVNTTGAGGVTGTTTVSKGKKDGYTLLVSRVGTNGTVTAINKTIPYKWDEFTFLGMLEINPVVFVVKADAPYKSLGDLVAAIKANPGKLHYSTSGPATILNMAPQMLLNLAGLQSTDATGIPYKGDGGAKTALLGGHVDFLAVNLISVIDAIKAGQLRALSISTKERSTDLPDVPTARETGYPDLEKIIGWSGLFGPPDLPAPVVAKWIAALQQIKADKTWIDMTLKLGSVPFIVSPEETKAFVKDQNDTYRQLGEKLGLIIE